MAGWRAGWRCPMSSSSNRSRRFGRSKPGCACVSFRERDRRRRRRSSSWRSSRRPWTRRVAGPAALRRTGRAVFLSIAAGKTLGYFATHLGANGQGRARDAQHAGGGAPGHHRGDCAAPAFPMPRRSAARSCSRRSAAPVGRGRGADRSGNGAVRQWAGLCLPVGRGDGGSGRQARPVGPTWPCSLRGRPSRAAVNCCGSRVNPRRSCALMSPSPGGTTAEALKVLMASDGIQPVFDKALAAASRRSKELAG